MCRDEDCGCCRGIGVALAGVSFSSLEEGIRTYFIILFGNQQQVTVAFKAAEKLLPNTLEGLF